MFLFAGEHDLLICARRGTPLAIGYGDGEMFVGSDALALAPLTRRITYLEDGDWAVVTSRDVAIFDAQTTPSASAAIHETAVSGALIGKGNYRHFMQKEIFEQPAVIGDTLHALIQPADRAACTCPICRLRWAISTKADDHRLRHLLLRRAGREILVRAHRPHAGRGRHRLGVPLPRAGHAEGRRWRSSSRSRARPPTRWRRCAIAAKQRQKIIAVVNQPESTIAREADVVLPTLAGPEIGVASTKAFTTQLAVLAALTVALARARGAHRRGAGGRARRSSSPKSRRAPPRC